MADRVRVTLTKREAESPFGRRLINQIMSMSDDGDLEVAEVAELHRLLREGPSEIEAVRFLRKITTGILADGQLDEIEAYELRRAMERVVSKAIRSDLTILLSRIGLPGSSSDWARSPSSESWRSDPMTDKQREFILDLGGQLRDGMTKGEASSLIDELLENRPPSPRQVMVLRFFDRLELCSSTKEEVSLWLDDFFFENEHYERAWHRFKVETKHSRNQRNPEVVPIGAYRKYVQERRTPSRESVASYTRVNPKRSNRVVVLGTLAVLTIVLIVVLVLVL